MSDFVAFLGVMGALLGSFASIMGGVALWILSGIKADIHALLQQQKEMFRDYIPRAESQRERDKLETRITRGETRTDELWADRTDTGMKPIRGRRKDDLP